MPGKVVIVLEAQDKEALTRIKEFGRGVQDTVDKLKAANPALDGTRVKVTQLTSAKVDASKAAQQWGTVLTQLPGPLGDIASRATTLTAGLSGGAGLAAAVIGVTTALGLLLKGMGDDIERLDNLSRQTGLSVQSLQAFEHAARQAGEAPEGLVMGLGRVNQAIADLIAGKDSAAGAFKAIGVDLEGMVRSGASAEQILDATARALAGIEDPTRRAAAQMDLFGNRGRAMSTVLDAIAKDGLGGYVRALTEAGIVTDERTNQMARAFDSFFDHVSAQSTSFWNRFKAQTAEAVMGILADLQILKEHGLVFGEELERLRAERVQSFLATERAPVDDRLTPSAAPGRDLSALDEARALKEAKASLEAMNDTRKMGVISAEAYAAASQHSAMVLEQEVKAADLAVKAFQDYTIRLDESRQATLENNRVIDANVGAYQQLGETTDLAARMAGEALRQLRGDTESLIDGATDADRAYLKLQRDLEGMSGSVERLAQNMATSAPIITKSFTEAFLEGFQIATDQLTTFFATWEAQGQLTAQNLHQAFAEVFFAAMHGDIKGIGDAFEGLWQRILGQIADFLASEAVKALIKFGKDLIDLITSGDSSHSSSSDSGIDVEDGLKIANIVLSEQKQLTLEQQRSVTVLEQQVQQARQLREEMEGARTAAQEFADSSQAGQGPGPGPGGAGRGLDLSGLRGFDVGSFDVGGAFKGALKGSVVGAPLGPIGMAAGGLIGGVIGGFDLLGKAAEAIKEAALNTFGIATEAQTAINNQSAAATVAFNEASRKSADAFDAMDDAATTAAAAAMNSAVAQDGLAESMEGLGRAANAGAQATNEATAATKDFGTGVTEMGDAIAGATEAAGRAAEAAAQAADVANGAADRAADSARDARDAADAAGGGDRGGGGPAGGEHDPSGPGNGPGGPGGAFALGGIITRPRRVLVGEAGPEAILGLPSQQRFAREMAAAIAASTPEDPAMQRNNELLARAVKVLEDIARGGRGGRFAGAVA